MFCHFRSQNIVTTNMALLENLFLLWCWDDLFFHHFTSIWTLNQLVLLSVYVESEVFILVFHAIKHNRFDNFVIIPVNVWLLLRLVIRRVRFSLELFLFGRMVLKNLLAFCENDVLVLLGLFEFCDLLFRKVEKILVSFINFHKIFVVAWGFLQKLKLWVALLSFTQRDEKILANFGHILSGMLNDCNLGLGNFLRLWSRESVRIWFLDLLEDSLQELSLLIFRFFNFHLLDFLLCHFLLFFLLALDDFGVVFLLCLLKELSTDICHHMIIVSSIRAVFLQECEFWIVHLPVKNHLFELRTVCCYVLSCLFNQFYR